MDERRHYQSAADLEDSDLYRPFCKYPVRARGQPSPDDLVMIIPTEAESMSEETGDALYNESAHTEALMPGWTPKQSRACSQAISVTPTIPLLPARATPSSVPPDPYTQVSDFEPLRRPPLPPRSSLDPEIAGTDISLVPSRRQMEALLFMAKTQRHGIPAIKLRLGWQDVPDEYIEDLLAGEIEHRDKKNMPMLPGSGQWAVWGYYFEDEGEDDPVDGQDAGGWSDVQDWLSYDDDDPSM
jgi:hypothetical protein